MASTMGNNTQDHPQVCFPINQGMRYWGIFSSRPNPFEHIIPLSMLHVIFLNIVSWAIYFLLKPLKQPKIVSDILAGIILGPSVLGRSKSYMENMFPPKQMGMLATMSNLAALLFIFLICIRMKPSMLSKTTKKTWRIGLASMVIPCLITLVLTKKIGEFVPGITSKSFPYVFSAVSSLSYFIVITHSLDELDLLSSELGQLSTSIAMLNEIVSFLTVLLGISITIHRDFQHLVYAILCLCGLLLFAIFVIRPVLLWIIKKTPEGEPVEDCYVTIIILCTLLLGLLTEAVGATYTPAAMIMGYIIPDGPPLGSTIIKRSELLITNVFLPYIFLRVGYFTDFSIILNWKEFAGFGIIILASNIGRLAACYMFSSTADLSKKNAILLGLCLSTQGMIELIQGIRWRHLTLFSEQDFVTWVLSIVILNGISTPIIKIFYKPDEEHDDNLLESFRSHKRSLGMTSIYGELRVVSCVQDEDNVPTVVSLLEALNPKEESPVCAYVIHLVPLATQTVPLLLPYKNHKKMFMKPNGSDKIMRAFFNYSKNSQGTLHIQPFRMVAPFKYMHEPICRLSEAIRAPLIIIPFFKKQELHNADGSLRIFNTNIQAFAKCTIGILVDRGLRTHLSLACFSYNVAVVFLGGAHDREALVLAARMSDHPNVAVTVLRIRFKGEAAKGFEQQRELDEVYFRDFKDMNTDNACVVCHELEADNSEEVMDALRAFVRKNRYDLVVVGKRQGCNSQFEESLIEWTEYPELGVIGDAIAQPDFSEGMMSVLVLQHIVEAPVRSGSSRSTFFLPS